jgi:serine/threonine protein kinase
MSGDGKERSEFPMDDDHFTFIKVLGQGAFGKVYKAIDNSTKQY